MDLISSMQNDRVKLVRLLQSQSKARRKQQRVVLEGLRLVNDALAGGIRPDFLLFTESYDQNSPVRDLITRLQAARVPCFPVIPDLMRELSDTETPQGVIAVFPLPDRPVPENPSLVVVADSWRDPGNLGTLLRTAAAAGVDLVALTRGTVDPYNPKTLRAGMGAHFRVAVRSFTWAELAARFDQMAFYLADAKGDTRYDVVDWTRPSVIVIGGEAHGFTDEAQHVPHTVIRIPMVEGAESLNAATAASVLIYEARRHALR